MPLNPNDIDFDALGIKPAKSESKLDDLDIDFSQLGISGVSRDALDDASPINIRPTVSEAVRVNPKAHAHIKYLNGLSNVPMNAIEDNPEAVEQSVKLQRVNFDELQVASPKTNQHLSEFDNAVIAQDDINVMAELERTLDSAGEAISQYGSDISTAFTAGTNAVEMSEIGNARMWAAIGANDPVPDEMLARLKEIEESNHSPIDDYGFIAGIPIAATEQLPIMYEILSTGLGYAAAGATVGGAGGAAIGAVTGPGALATATVGAIGGGKWAGRLGVAKAAFDLESGLAFNEFVAMRDGGVKDPLTGKSLTEGKLIDPEIAGYAAATVGGINALLEAASLAAWGRTVTPVMRTMVRSRIKKALRSETQREVLLKLARNYALAVATETATEGAQEFTTVVGGEFAKYADQSSFTEQDLSAALDNIFSDQTGKRVLHSMEKAAQASILLSAPGTAVTAVADARQRKQLSESEQVQIDHLNSVAEQFNMKELDKESFRQMVEEVDGDNNTTVFIDGAQVSLYLSGKSASDIQNDPALKILAAQVHEAANLHSDVQINAADFAAEIVGTDHYAQLRDAMTLSTETTSPFRSEQAAQASQSYIRNLMIVAQGDAADAADAQSIYTDVRDQLVDAGVYSSENAAVMAEIVPAWATASAERQGKSVAQVYTDAGLTIEGPQSGEKVRVAGEKALQVAREQGYAGTIIDEATEYNQAVSRGLDMSHDARMSRAAEQGFDTSVTLYAVQSDSGQFVTSEDGAIYVTAEVTKLEGSTEGHVTAVVVKSGQTDAIDGLTPVSDPADIKSINAAFDPGFNSDNSPLSQSVDPDLFIAHNLSADNVMAANDLGGLAAPSIAVARTGVSDFSGFGDITLLADKSLLNDPKARTFDADIYSPRQPRATYDVNEKRYRNFTDTLDPDEYGLTIPDIQSMEESNGPDNFLRSNSVQYQWLQSQGKAPTAKKLKVDPAIRKAAKLGLPRYGMTENPKFIKIATDHYTMVVAKMNEVDRDGSGPDYWQNLFFESDGSVKRSNLNDLESKVASYNESGSVDVHKLNSDIGKKLRPAKVRSDYEQWATGEFNSLVDGKKLFNGFTAAGNHRYTEYNMQNVVKDMTRQLQAGESTFYGVGSVRSAYAKELKTIAQVQAARGGIVSEDDMSKVKDESNEVFKEALDKLKPFYKFDSDGWGYGSDAGAAIIEGRKGLNEAFDMTPEAQKIVDDLIEYLIALPTSYFESKIQRAVGFSEFNTAIVPRGVRKDALQVLKDAGLKIKTYNPAVEGARDDAIAKQKSLLFQPAARGQVRGEYDPVDSAIRLTEAADLTTFLHEFAHFMYEMELRGDTELLQSINNWYKRNAVSVAKEANRYMGQNFSSLEQGAVTELDGDRNASMIETGKPTSFYFTHNTESATAIFGKPKKGDEFGRDFEPAARFVNVVSKSISESTQGQRIGGKLTFNNPLVVPGDGIKWKGVLSKQYNGKTGKALSKALIADGYDGIFTTDGEYISETIDFTTFDESKALFQTTDSTSVEARKQRAKAQGFDVDNVLYHGSNRAGFREFILPANRKTDGTGVFLTDDFDQARSYQSSDGGVVDFFTGEEIFNNPDLVDGVEIITQYGIADDNGTLVSDVYDFDSMSEFKSEIDKGYIDESEDGSPVELYTITDPEGYEIVLEDTKENAIKELNELAVEQPGVIELYVRLNDKDTKTVDWKGNNWDDSPPESFGLVDSSGDVFEWVYDEGEAQSRLESDDQVVEVQPDTPMTTDEHARVARDQGFDAVRFTNVVDPGPYGFGGEDGNVTVVFDPKNIRSVNAQFQDPNSTNILAQTDIVPTPSDSGPVTSEDVVQFLDQKTTGDAAKDSAIRRAVHEQFARGFETYLMEGDSPSIELRNAFRTFARWIVRVYQAVKGRLNVNVDNEMRQVFDRLIATEEQMQAARVRAKVEPMFTDAAMAGMTEEAFAEYQTRQGQVRDEQTETLRDKVLAHLTRRKEEWWAEEKQVLTDVEVDRIKRERVYITRERLRTGDIKIDRITVKLMVGVNRTDKLNRTSVVMPPALNSMTATGQLGIHPDEAAAIFGYDSGSEMLQDLINAPKLMDAAEAAAEQRMRELHGDILTDGTIEREADEAVLDDARGRLILKELQILNRGTNTPAIERKLIKDIALERIAKLSFREIHPGKYRRAEVRAAQESTKLFIEGDQVAAAAAKTRQVMNHYLGMAATDAKNDIVAIVGKTARYNKKSVREAIMKAGNNYWEQLTKILSRFEFRKSATLTQVDSLNLWVKERNESDGDGITLSPAVMNESYTTHWKNVPYGELQGISDSVKNIEHVARYANRIKIADEELTFKKAKSEWIDHINTQDQRFDTMSSRSRTADSSDATAMEHIRRWAPWLTKVPFLASWLDGGERAGMSHDVLIQPFTDALDFKMRLIDEVANPVVKDIGARSKEDVRRHKTKIFIPEINDHLEGHQVLAVALNTGNASNLKKLLLGEGWANPKNEAEINFNNPKLQAILAHMTKSDWEFVQRTWDQMETLYPMLADVHRRTTGLTPPKVVPTPVITKHGVFNGGYYPMKYSPRRSHQAAKNAEKLNAETESMFNNTASIQASVNASATSERTGFYDRVYLSLEVIPDHFNETIHYITHHDAVRNVNRMIQSPDVADAITGVLGESEYNQLRPWLNDIAKDGRQQPTKTYIDVAFQRLRFGTTLGVMGFKVSTGIMQLFGIMTTAAELGVGPTVRGVVDVVGYSWYMNAIRKTLGSREDMQTGWDFAAERSKVMPHRMTTLDREIRSAMDRLKGKSGILPAVQEASMKHIALIQTYMIDLPTWHAAYQKELSESGNEAKAINRADWSVENLQGSGATMNMSAILRNQNKVLTTMTMFMTFFSSLGNLSRDLVKGAKSGQYSITSVAAKLMFLYTLPVFMEMLMRGNMDEPDGEDERLGKFATGVALYPLTSVPFVRDAASGLIGDYGYNVSPVAAVLEKGILGYKQFGDRALTDDEVTKTAVKNVSKLTGAALGIPGVNQTWATGEHLYDVMENGEDLTVRELIFGPDRK